MGIDKKAVLYFILLLLLLILGKVDLETTPVKISAAENVIDSNTEHDKSELDTGSNTEHDNSELDTDINTEHENSELDETNAEEMPIDDEHIYETITGATNNMMPIPNNTVPIPNSTVPIPNSTVPIPNSTVPIPNSTVPIPNNTVPIPNNVEDSKQPEPTNIVEKDAALEEITFAKGADIIDSENIVVYNFDEFNSALSANNKYVNIYLGADIEMKAGGIIIHTNKKRVVINGINPLNGLGPYTINENKSLDPGYTIRVISNLGAKDITMKNINVIGRNFYGAVCAYDGVDDVTITFENITYNGPQISYNRGGTVRITGNSHIQIHGNNGLSRAQELAEANALELGGNTVINHYSPELSAVWLVGSGSYIKVLTGANILWNETGTYMFFQDSLTPTDFTMEKDSRLTINTLNGLFFDSSNLYHQFGNVLIGSGAMLEINQQAQEAASRSILKVKKSFQVLEGASLILISQSAPQLIDMTDAVNFIAKSPNTLVLYNETGKLLDWNNTSAQKVSILSTFLNYWRNPCDIGVLGRFDDSPLYRFRKKDGEDLLIEITASSNGTSSVISNYTEADYGNAPSADMLDMQSAKIITAGRLTLTLENITDTSSYISGETESRAMLRATYTDTESIGRTLYGNADYGGAFDINLQNGSTPLASSKVEVCSSIGYKNVIESTTVTQLPNDRLMFIHVPDYLLFQDTKISFERKLIPKADNDWHITIGDSRYQGSPWKLHAKLLYPLRALRGDMEHIIEEAVVYIDNDGSKNIINGTPTEIESGIKTSEPETIVIWPDDRGIMLDIDTLKVYTGIEYLAEIEWILVDGP